MNRRFRILLSVMALALSACSGDQQDPLSVQVITLNATQLPDGGKWNELLGRPLIAVEYKTRRRTGTGGRTLYLYDARWGECRTAIHAPASPGDPMLIVWAPCK